MRINNEYKVVVNILRHGKTEFNERHCYIGITDEELSENGINELKEKAKSGIYSDIDMLFTSPMKRAVQSSKIMYPQMNGTIIEEFSEMDFGSFEGKNYDELKDNLFYRKWIDEARGISKEEIDELYGDIGDPKKVGIQMPEEMDSYYGRVLEGFMKVLKMSEERNEVSVVAHGGTIMAVASALSKEDYYSFMFGCGDGIKTLVEFKDNDGTIEISRFCITDRIHS